MTKGKSTESAKTSTRKGCPVSREEFDKEAKPLTLSMDGQSIVANPKQFATGSFGWFSTQKVSVKIGEETVLVQVGLNMIIVGSKEVS